MSSMDLINGAALAVRLALLTTRAATELAGRARLYSSPLDYRSGGRWYGMKLTWYRADNAGGLVAARRKDMPAFLLWQDEGKMLYRVSSSAVVLGSACTFPYIFGRHVDAGRVARRVFPDGDAVFILGCHSGLGASSCTVGLTVWCDSSSWVPGVIARGREGQAVRVGLMGHGGKHGVTRGCWRKPSELRYRNPLLRGLDKPVTRP